MICDRCNDSGEIGIGTSYHGGERPGPVPEDARGWTPAIYPDCRAAVADEPDDEQRARSWDNVEARRMTTDETDETDQAEHAVFGECDTCGKRAVRLTQCWPWGTETWACDECRGVEEGGLPSKGCRRNEE